MAKSKNAEESYTFYWNIKNMRCSTLQNGEFITSPSFSIPNFEKTTWCLRLYPKGVNRKCMDFTSLYLNREDDLGALNTIAIKYDLGILFTDQMTSLESSFAKSTINGIHKFLNNAQSSLYESSFPIVCKMRFNKSTVADHLPMNKVLCTETLNHVLVLDEHKVSFNRTKISNQDDGRQETQAEVEIWPTECFSESEFFGEHCIIEWFVDGGIMKKEGYSQKIRITQGILPLCITLTKKSEFIDVDIDRKYGSIKERELVVCRLTVSTEETESTLLFEKSLEFLQHELSCFFEKAFKLSDLKEGLGETVPEMANWRLELTFADGKVRSNILKENNKSCDDVPSHCVNEQMVQFYKDDKLCDLTLIVGEEEFLVHKVVLAAMSPVFLFMLENEDTEIEIIDFDKDVVCDMISFMYDGNLDNLDFAKAKELFTAAVKYRVLPLKNYCRRFMIDSINVENIASVISFANSHNDRKLEAAAIDFICHFQSVLLSDHWKEFEKENAVLCVKILKKVFLGLK